MVYHGQVTRSTPELAPNGILGDIVRTHRRDFGPHRFYEHVCPSVLGRPGDF